MYLHGCIQAESLSVHQDILLAKTPANLAHFTDMADHKNSNLFALQITSRGYKK
ncbi:hypothetical protein Ancab_021755, partial [Ancistrocladus abbreviatus]